MSPFKLFSNQIRAGGIDGVRRGLIGRDAHVETGFGRHRLVYADYVASGRALAQIEDFVRDTVLPYYANTHTEASYCGQVCTRLREGARAEIRRIASAGPDCHVIFSGSGATAGLNRLVAMLGIGDMVRGGGSAVVLIGPYEHHSNILPWRESGARVVEIAEADGGGVDLAALEAALTAHARAGLVVGSFSACSNVTGIVTDPDPVTRLLKAHGALAVWDYAGGGPYLPIEMESHAGCGKDAIVLSPHKFPGGPGASGLLIVRDTVIRTDRPAVPGGGTVTFVSPWTQDYSARIEAREEGGTPNVVGDIRAALALLVKEAIGADEIARIDTDLRARALNAWRHHPQIDLLGADAAVDALPILSFRLRDRTGRPVHHQLVTRMLSDHYGVQARGGCACAGPYAHRLLGLDEAASRALRDRLRAGHELDKPGWVRLNLSYLHSRDDVETILTAVIDLADRVDHLASLYHADERTARFRPVGDGHAAGIEPIPA